jgi:hypothetical protein
MVAFIGAKHAAINPESVALSRLRRSAFSEARRTIAQFESLHVSLFDRP